MRRMAIGVLVAVVLVSMVAAAQEPERLFKAAMNTELVDGNLRLAIEQYAKVAASGNRSLAAQALMRMAECHEKLGNAEARAITSACFVTTAINGTRSRWLAGAWEMAAPSPRRQRVIVPCGPAPMRTVSEASRPTAVI